MFNYYKKCVFCKSRKLKILKNQYTPNNFYVQAIKADLNLKKKISRLKIFECQNCKNLQNNPWFDLKTAKKIYSNIYGQHNKNWSNLLKYFYNKRLPDHGRLFEILTKVIKIKNYAEFNSPFMGFFLNYFDAEYQNNFLAKKKIFNTTLNYLSSRQLVGRSKNFIDKKFKNTFNLVKRINNLKKKLLISNKTKKFLIIENNSSSWGYNDNYKSVNSRSLAVDLFDLEIIDINEDQNNLKFNLFCFFLTLDHTLKPSKILDYALNVSDYVLVQCHIDKYLNQQHLFSFSDNIINFLVKKKLYVYNLNQFVSKNNAKILYFICTKSKKKYDFIHTKFANF